MSRLWRHALPLRHFSPLRLVRTLIYKEFNVSCWNRIIARGKLQPLQAASRVAGLGYLEPAWEP